MWHEGVGDLLELDGCYPGPELPEVGHESDGVAEDNDDADVDSNPGHHQVPLADVALDIKQIESIHALINLIFNFDCN